MAFRIDEALNELLELLEPENEKFQKYSEVAAEFREYIKNVVFKNDRKFSSTVEAISNRFGVNNNSSNPNSNITIDEEDLTDDELTKIDPEYAQKLQDYQQSKLRAVEKLKQKIQKDTTDLQNQSRPAAKF